MRKIILILVTLCAQIICAYQGISNNIDLYVEKLPSRVKTVEELSSFFDSDTLNDYEKIRGVFLWITENIAIDVEACFTGTTGALKTNEILSEQKATSSQYALLFDSVCKILHIESYPVKGYDMRSYKNGNTNHFWNVVNADNSWYFIDCMLGSGTIQNTMKKSSADRMLFRSSIKSKAVFIKQRNDSYFMFIPDDLLITNIPADPMWQFNNQPKALECIHNQDECLSNNEPFHFNDSLRKYKMLNDYEKHITSGDRALHYNPQNSNDIAMAYADYGLYHYKTALQIVPVTSEYYQEEILKTIENLTMALMYFEKSKTMDDSLYLDEVSGFKEKYRTISGKIKNYQKITSKAISSNNKILIKQKDEKKRTKEKIQTSKNNAVKFTQDTKIYYTNRPDEIPGHADSLVFMAALFRADSIYNTAVQLADSLTSSIEINFSLLFDSIVQLRKIIPELLLNIQESNDQIQALYIENHPESFDACHSLFEFHGLLFQSLSVYEEYSALLVKHDLKILHDQIKKDIRVLENKLKETKRELILCKKSTLIDRDEEEKYDECNLLANTVYTKYITRLTNQTRFFDEIKTPVKKENKELKKVLKATKKTNHIIALFYTNNLVQKKTVRTNEKLYYKDLNKQLSKINNFCIKMLPEEKRPE